MHWILFLLAIWMQKRLLLFYKPFVAQQSAGSIHTVSGNCWHACTDPWIPRTTGHTAPTQADRLWAISGVLPYLCSSEHRSCRSGTAEQRRTPRALRIQHLDLDWSVCAEVLHTQDCNLPISSQDGSDRRDLMENPGLTFKLILTDTLCSGIESTFSYVQTHSIRHRQLPSYKTQASNDWGSNLRSLDYP